MLGLGQLPKEYNKAVHGPYDPAIFYGKKDTPLSQVKLYQLPAWLARRNPSPVAMGRAVSRAYWRWNHKYVLPKYSGITPVLQLTVAWSALFYCLNYSGISHHTNAKYHW
ncbi:putative ATP synthase subunit f, mitochondrial [Eurytemora carolleeae]|uniref:putative ATP synthase subunit f, mitochondrial n=1 Tax=Eurytemora carolleeae TaxID=1294199 RepID=UPI000C75928B|nr:putative ATP synthase subunit f, mitochondrial [Eurytemora carolleeae]|eukprot:XP_023328911.1 putative ATP synthase subunit f, mitochondrial [Eurytemora affinis]